MTPNTSGQHETVSWIKTNRGVAACMTLVTIGLLIYLASTDWVYDRLRDGFSLGFFTVVAAFAMLICTVFLMIDKHRHDVDPDIAKAEGKDWLIVLCGLFACYAYYQAAWTFDFLLVTPVFLGAGMYFLGVRPIRAAAISAVIATLVIYGLFRAIQIELPTIIPGLS